MIFVQILAFCLVAGCLSSGWVSVHYLDFCLVIGFLSSGWMHARHQVKGTVWLQAKVEPNFFKGPSVFLARGPRGRLPISPTLGVLTDFPDFPMISHNPPYPPTLGDLIPIPPYFPF